jgi:hypothetical protein
MVFVIPSQQEIFEERGLGWWEGRLACRLEQQVRHQIIEPNHWGNSQATVVFHY